MNTETKGDKVKLETGTLKYYPLAQAAELVGMKASRLHEMVSTGEFRPEISLGMAYIFTPNDIARLRPLAKVERKKESVLVPGQQACTCKQLAKEWGMSPDAIRKIFENEDGVIKIGNPNPKRGRRYVSIRIPIEVAERVQRRLS